GRPGRGGRVRPSPPDPAPAVFGYHEVFHLLVFAGAPPTSWPSACTPCPAADHLPSVDRAGDGPPLRVPVGAAPLGFGVDDPATRGRCLETLGLGPARLTAPLVASGRAPLSLRAPLVRRNLHGRVAGS